MTLHVLKPGMQTTIQGAPRRGYRHLGIPASGPADPLSLALANRLLDNTLMSAGLEVSLSGVAFGVTVRTAIAVTGADVSVQLNGRSVPVHMAIELKAGDEVVTSGAASGARAYIAVAGGLSGDTVLNSQSTCLPAGLGGQNGRALEAGDELHICERAFPGNAATPDKFRPPADTRLALRACPMDSDQHGSLFEQQWHVGRRADRMGIQLEGANFVSPDTGRLPSVPVFPGCVQCPPDGSPFLLSVDAQTTGGYARLAQVVRADRHVIGQLRAGDSLRFLPRTPEQANADFRDKVAYWSAWLPGCDAVFI